jgi:hypothetical protein
MPAANLSHVVQERRKIDSRLAKNIPQGAWRQRTMIRDRNVPLPTRQLNVRSFLSYPFKPQSLQSLRDIQSREAPR